MFWPSKALLTKRLPHEYTEANEPVNEEGSSQPINVVLLDTADIDPEFQPWAVAQLARLFSLLGQGEDIAVYERTQAGLVLRHQFSHSSAHLVGSLIPAALVHEQTSGEFTPDLKKIGP